MIADGSGEADLQNMIEEALPIACNSLNLEGGPEPEEVGYMISIIGNADPLNLVQEQAGEINATIIELPVLAEKNLFDLVKPVEEEDIPISFSFSDLPNLFPDDENSLISDPIAVSDVSPFVGGIEEQTFSQPVKTLKPFCIRACR